MKPFLIPLLVLCGLVRPYAVVIKIGAPKITMKSPVASSMGAATQRKLPVFVEKSSV
jgi:hypothetical protein